VDNGSVIKVNTFFKHFLDLILWELSIWTEPSILDQAIYCFQLIFSLVPFSEFFDTFGISRIHLLTVNPIFR